MKLRTDDDIWRVRLLWLGPPGYTLPIHLPYAQWFMWFVLTGIFSAILVPLTGAWSSTGMAVAAAMIATHFVWRQVDPDRPALKVMFTAVIDAKRVKPTAKPAIDRLSATHIRVTEHITGDSR